MLYKFFIIIITTTTIVIIIIIIIIKNEKIRVTICENAAGALYIVNKSLLLLLKDPEG